MPKSKSELDDESLRPEDIEGAMRVFGSLERLVQRPQLVEQTNASPERLAKLAKQLRSARRARSRFFDPYLFGEPGWDMLLALFIANFDQHRTLISQLCADSGGPMTTALRWMQVLTERGFVTRRPNPLDARTTFVEITDEGRAAVTRYLAHVWHHHFPFD